MDYKEIIEDIEKEKYAGTWKIDDTRLAIEVIQLKILNKILNKILEKIT